LSLSAQDLLHHEFSKAMRGYDVAEVRAFLERIADEITILQQQAASISEQNRALAAKLTAYQEMEHGLRDSLVATQENQRITHEQLLIEREQILREARLEGERTKFDIEREIAKLREELNQIKIHRDTFVKRLRFLLKAQSELIELIEENNSDPSHEHS
jgi:cell division initiation protein